MCHLDLLAECAFSGASDRELCTRPTPCWPSPYETNYPYGTRCRWAAFLPPLADVLDLVHWFIREPQHKWILLLCLQKVCPHKYMGRGSPDMLMKACRKDGPMCAIIAELLLCSEFGAYSHAVCLPYLPRSLALWWSMKTDRLSTVRCIRDKCPGYLLFAWKEAVIWSLQLRPDLLQFVRLRYQWDRFSEMTVQAMNRIRELLARPGYIDAEELDALATVCHEKMKSPTSKRVLRLPFKVLMCKHLDGVLRNKLRGNGIDNTGVPGLEHCGPAQLARTFRDDVKENRMGQLSLLRKDQLGMEEVLRVAEIPERCKMFIRGIQRLFDAYSIADTATKRRIDDAIEGLTDEELLSLHRLLAHACSPNAVSVIPLSRAASEAHLRILAPEERPIYVCTCCGRVGATVVQEIQAADGSITYKLKRGLKDVAYSFGCDAVFCNKKTKKISPTKKRRTQPRATTTGNTLVPQQLMHRLLLKTCGKRAMICIDKRGLLMRINKRVLAACCTCGALAELNSATCIAAEPECAYCKVRALGTPTSSRGIDAKRQACDVCHGLRPVNSLQRILVFQDDNPAIQATFNRIIQIHVCSKHVEGSGPLSSLHQLRRHVHRTRSNCNRRRRHPGVTKTDDDRDGDTTLRVAAKERRRWQLALNRRLAETKKRARERRTDIVDRLLDAGEEQDATARQPVAKTKHNIETDACPASCTCTQL